MIGQKLQIDKNVFTVVGVMPKRFIGADPLQRPELFAPLALEPILDAPRSMTEAGFHAWWLTVMGRMQPGITLAQANAQIASVATPADSQLRDVHFTAESGSAGFTYVRMLFRRPLRAGSAARSQTRSATTGGRAVRAC